MRPFVVCLVIGAFAGSCGNDVTEARLGGAVTIEPVDATIDVDLKGALPVQSYSAFATMHGERTEITNRCNWSIADVSFGDFDAATFRAERVGGTTRVTASCADVSASTSVTLRLTGSVVQGMAPANVRVLFDNAVVAMDPARTPAIEYPLDGAIAPSNIPAIDTQWSVAQNDLFHVTFTSTYVAVDIFTTNADAMFDAGTWTLVTTLAKKDTIAIRVEGMKLAMPATKYVSKAANLSIARDTIDDTAI